MNGKKKRFSKLDDEASLINGGAGGPHGRSPGSKRASLIKGSTGGPHGRSPGSKRAKDPAPSPAHTKPLTKLQAGSPVVAKKEDPLLASKDYPLIGDLLESRDLMSESTSQLEQLLREKETLEQQMKVCYIEKVDLIGELEDFINKQVTDLDKKEVAMKQMEANKQLLEKDYQKFNEYYSATKKLVGEYEKRYIAQEESTSNKIRALESENEALIQSNKKISREVARLMSVDSDLLNLQKENEKYKAQLCKEEIETDNLKDQLIQLETDRKTQEQQIKVLQAQLEKASDPLENTEELKEVEDLEEEIGRGSYGVVKKMSVHGTICAAKDIHALLINYANDTELERIKKSFLEECVKCSKLFHPNIVQFLGIHYPSKQAKLPWLVMELLDYSLTGFVKKYDKESISPFVKASIFCDISLGLQFLHGRDIIHRDLSSNNVLLTKHLTAKISDFGVAKLVDASGTKSHTVAPGTQHFLPPEVFSDAAKSHYGKPIDVFSLGCIMIHVGTHEWPAPLPETHYDSELKKKVALSEIERREAYLNKIQELPELKVLVENCLHDDPGLRPNATEMVDEIGKLKILYQKKSSFVSNEMNAIEFEQRLKLQDKTISEQLLEIQNLNKMIQEAHEPLQGSYLSCHKCNRQFRKDQVPEYRHHIDNCRH